MKNCNQNGIFLFILSTTLRRDMDRLVNENRMHQRDVSLREVKIRELSERQTKLSYELKELVKLESQVSDLAADRHRFEEQIKVRRNLIKTAERDASDTGTKLVKLKKELDTARKEATSKEEQLTKELAILNSSLSRIMNIESEVSRYVNQGKEDQLRRNQADVERLQNDSAQLESELAQGK